MPPEPIQGASCCLANPVGQCEHREQPAVQWQDHQSVLIELKC